MTTMILMLIVGMLAFVITPWIGYLNHTTVHKTDLMAGSEGDD